MNILFFSRLFHPHIGGVEKHVLEISKILSRQGHNISVITESPGDKDKIGKIEIVRINNGRDDWFKKFRVWLSLLKNLKLIKEADVIHIHDVFFWFLPFRIIFPSKKVFMTFHGYEGDKIPGVKSKILYKLAEKLSNGNVCVGDFFRKWYGAEPDYVIYGGVNVSEIKNKISKIKKTNKVSKILFLGRLEEETGIMVYLEALKLLKNNNYKLELIVLGDGALKKQAENFAKRNKLKVYFKGFVNNVTQYLKNSDIVFTSRYLGILEAISFGKFVFAVYNNEIKKDYLSKAPFSKFISISSDVEELASRVEFYLKEKDLREKMVKQGNRWVQDKTWDNVAKIYLKLWNKI